jgi:hypothetical protein
LLLEEVERCSPGEMWIDRQKRESGRWMTGRPIDRYIDRQIDRRMIHKRWIDT